MLRIEPIVDDKFGQLVNVDRDFWNQHAISPGSNSCLKCCKTSITTKQAEQYSLAMRPCGRANTVDKFCCAIDGCLETDTIIRTRYIIIHRFRYTPDWNTFR